MHSVHELVVDELGAGLIAIECIPAMFIGNLQLQDDNDITAMLNLRIWWNAGKGECYCTVNVHVDQRAKAVSLQ